MTVFRAATLRIFFFAFHAGAKELNLRYVLYATTHAQNIFLLIENE